MSTYEIGEHAEPELVPSLDRPRDPTGNNAMPARKSCSTEQEKLRRRIAELESRCAALINDKDRAVAAALDTAADCAAHGQEIQYLRHMTSWFCHRMNDADEARMAAVKALILSRDRLPAGDIPAATVAEWIDRWLNAHSRVLARPSKYPTPAGCARAGGCDHHDVIPQAKAEWQDDTR